MLPDIIGHLKQYRYEGRMKAYLESRKNNATSFYHKKINLADSIHAMIYFSSQFIQREKLKNLLPLMEEIYLSIPINELDTSTNKNAAFFIAKNMSLSDAEKNLRVELTSNLKQIRIKIRELNLNQKRVFRKKTVDFMGKTELALDNLGFEKISELSTDKVIHFIEKEKILIKKLASLKSDLTDAFQNPADVKNEQFLMSSFFHEIPNIKKRMVRKYFNLEIKRISVEKPMR